MANSKKQHNAFPPYDDNNFYYHCYIAGNFFANSARSHWLLRGHIHTYIQWHLDITKVKGLAIFVRHKEVSLYRGTFPYILLLLG